jgi:hypothetical protein
MIRLQVHRAIGAVAFGIGALGVGTALHLPAVAAQTYQHVVAPMLTGSCSSSSPCDEEINTSSGPAFKGISDGGNGVTGQTSATSFHAGVLGQDISTSGTFDAGVFGKSINGYGVEGVVSLNEDGYGNGVYASSTSGSALYAQSTYSDGVQIIDPSGTGLYSVIQNNSNNFRGRSGLWGHDDSTDGGQLNVGVEGSSTYGFGVQANSGEYVGVNVVGGNPTGNFYPAMSVVGGPSGPAYLILACANSADDPCLGSSASRVLYLDNLGDLGINGEIYTSGSCSSGCIARNSGAPSRRVLSYTPTQTTPGIVDIGQAQAVNGRAYVPLSPDFANVVDPLAGYLVFITPEGDNKGVYVTHKTHAGFEVKECQNGRSTFAFSYRIVAKPFGVNRPRLPMETRQPARTLGTGSHLPTGAP